MAKRRAARARSFFLSLSCQTPALRACHPEGVRGTAPQASRCGEHLGRVGFNGGHPCPTLRATSLSLQGEPANIGKR
jgi:hypothetical protein